jgi:hypothetical protein
MESLAWLGTGYITLLARVPAMLDVVKPCHGTGRISDSGGYAGPYDCERGTSRRRR